MRFSTFWAVLGWGLGGAVGPCAAQAFYYLPAPEVAVARAAGSGYVARVVDARPQHASIGLVMRGGTAQAATFHEGMASTLPTFFGKYAPGQPGAVPLVLRLSGLEIAEMDFFFWGPADEGPVARKASSGRAASAGTLAGGSLGGLAAAAVDAAVSDGPRTQQKLSILTGEVRLAQSNTTAATAVANRPTHRFIYRPRSEKGPAARIRLAEGQPAQERAAGAFLTFEPTSDEPLQVCLVPAAGPETRLTITPTTEAPTYLDSNAAPRPPRRAAR